MRKAVERVLSPLWQVMQMQFSEELKERRVTLMNQMLSAFNISVHRRDKSDERSVLADSS